MRLIVALLLLSFTSVALASDSDEAADLRRRVEKLDGRINKVSKRQLERFYRVRYGTPVVKEAQHQCYLALLDAYDTHRENRDRNKSLRFVEKELNKLRKGFGKLAKLTADQVAACEQRRTPECERLIKLPDNTETRYYRSEIDVLKNDARRESEAIKAHARMVEQAKTRCQAALDALP